VPVAKPERNRRFATLGELIDLLMAQRKQGINKYRVGSHEANFLSKAKRMTKTKGWVSQDKRSILAVCVKLMSLRNEISFGFGVMFCAHNLCGVPIFLIIEALTQPKNYRLKSERSAVYRTKVTMIKHKIKDYIIPYP
jgi:hypothetical protein